MSGLFPVGMGAVEMHGMSVITFIALGFYSLGLIAVVGWVTKEFGCITMELKELDNRIDDVCDDHMSIAKQLNDTNTKMLVAVATLTEKVDNLERFLRDR